METTSSMVSGEPTSTEMPPTGNPDLTASVAPSPEVAMPTDSSMSPSPTAGGMSPTASPADANTPTSPEMSPALTPSDGPAETLPTETAASPTSTVGGAADENEVDDDAESESEVSAEPVCIDANALSHLSSDELVYKEHRRGAVLCDKNGSCATPGHMVMYNGSFMMMSSYCSHIGGCAKRVMNVNSPRHRRALKIDSRTDGLQYTSLAARYATVAEEHVLKTLLRVGV